MTEHAKWHKFLQPLIGALALFIAAATAGLYRKAIATMPMPAVERFRASS